MSSGFAIVCFAALCAFGVGLATSCSKSDASTERPTGATSSLVDVSWRAAVGDEMWLSGEQNVIVAITKQGKPTEKTSSRQRRYHRMYLKVLEVDSYGHPARIEFSVEQHEEMLFSGPPGSFDGPWTPAADKPRSLAPPPLTRFTARWHPSLNRWGADTKEEEANFALVTKDMRAKWSTRLLIEELRPERIPFGTTVEVKDRARQELVKEAFGQDAEYTVRITHKPAGEMIDDARFTVLESVREMTWKDDALKGQRIPSKLTTTATVRVSEMQPIRVLFESTGGSVTEASDGQVLTRIIKTVETMEAPRQ